MAACARPPQKPPLPKDAIGICETCVGTVHGWSIGVSNIWARNINGKMQPAAQLSLWKDGKDGPHLTVVVGSTFDLDGETYEVIEIDNPDGRTGSIAVRKVAKPQ
jgi:hypothetical protein